MTNIIEKKESNIVTNIYSSIVGRKLKRIRKISGLSGAKVANQLGISQQHYSRYECGQSRIPVDILFNIFSILDIDFVDFFIYLKIDYSDTLFDAILNDTHKDIDDYFLTNSEFLVHSSMKKK